MHTISSVFSNYNKYSHKISSENAFVRPGSIDPMTAVVQRVKGFAYYSLSFSRHNKNIKMEHFFLYILSRYFIWLHKWKGFNDICASLKYKRMIDYSYQLFLILYPPTLYRLEALFFTGLTDTISSGPVINQR